MAYIRERRKLLTGAQDRSPWSPETDLQYDFIMVYGIDGENLADVPHKLKEWRELINA